VSALARQQNYELPEVIRELLDFQRRARRHHAETVHPYRHALNYVIAALRTRFAWMVWLELRLNDAAAW
jgi:hypothetical protein